MGALATLHLQLPLPLPLPLRKHIPSFTSHPSHGIVHMPFVSCHPSYAYAVHAAPALRQALKHGGITGMMDRLDNPSKMKCAELASAHTRFALPLPLSGHA